MDVRILWLLDSLQSGVFPFKRLSFKDLPTRKCVEDQNSDSEAYNQKLLKLLKNLEAKLSGSTVLYADIFTPIMDMVNNPHKYGKSGKYFREIKL